MKRRKLLKTLTDLLDTEGQKQRRHHAKLKALLEKLEEKKVELEQKAPSEKDKRKQKRLYKELEIVKAQQAKGTEALGDLENL